MNLFSRAKLMFTAFCLSMFASVAAFATAPAAPSVTDVTGYIESLAVPIGLVGAAVLILTLGVKAYKWIRRAM